MKVQLQTWFCPDCGEPVDIPIETTAGPNVVKVRVPDTALPDVYAHHWTHRETA